MASAPTPGFRPRRGSIVGGIILIGLGLLLLLGNLQPDFHVWRILTRYWPLILIFIGIAKLWDSSRSGSVRDGAGAFIALAVLVLLVAGGLTLAHYRGDWRRGFQVEHKTEEVDLKGAESVNATLDMPTGELQISGGASKLAEANFDYVESEGVPVLEYRVSGAHGDLNVRQERTGRVRLHMAGRENTWRLRLNERVPLELNIHMGAGQGDLRLGGLSLTRLEAHVGAGVLMLDLRGNWKKNLEAEIHGGVGSATIRLPKNVGVRVNATAGLGSISAAGLKRDGDDYVNDAYGKSPVTLNVNVHGGLGTIRLEPEL